MGRSYFEHHFIISKMAICTIHVFNYQRYKCHYLRIGESPSKYPFLKNNGSEAPKGPRIHYFSGMDTYEDCLRLKIHHTLAPLFRYNKA